MVASADADGGAPAQRIRLNTVAPARWQPLVLRMLDRPNILIPCPRYRRSPIDSTSAEFFQRKQLALLRKWNRTGDSRGDLRIFQNMDLLKGGKYLLRRGTFKFWRKKL